jgi:hypothetical protein
MDQCAQDSASKCNQQCRFFINELDASGMVLWFMMIPWSGFTFYTSL